MTAAFDRFASSRTTAIVAFGWGFAEATFFFLVPDVCLTLVGCRAVRPALKASVAALAGALIGGTVMYELGNRFPEDARSFLNNVPGISVPLVARVDSQISEHGLSAVALGPLLGIPYKIYAVEWGAHRRGLWSFLLISVPARYVRFFVTTVAAHFIARVVRRVARRPGVELWLLGLFWTGFYVFYFGRLGF